MGEQEHRDDLFHQVLTEYGPGLWRLTAGYARTRADREDLYQDILLAILGALPSFRQESSLRTYVYRIGHNQGTSHRRHWTRLPVTVPVDDLVAHSPSPEAAAIAEAQRSRLLEAIRALPHDRRQVLMLSLEGLDHGEIGQVLGLSTNNVAVRLHRARTDLRRILDPATEEGLRL